MAKKQSAVQAKRQAVLKKHGNAMRKLRRMERVNGAKVAGTEFDPTRDPAKLKTYNSKQLASYESQLNEFLSRRVQYVGDAQGRPMPKQKWNTYVRLKTKISDNATAELEANAGTFMPFAGQTIGDRVQAMTSDRTHMHNPAVHNPRYVKDLKSSRVASEEALDTLIADAREKARPGYRDVMTQQRRDNFARIAEDAPDDIRVRTNALTDHQFNVLWAFTDFVDELSTHYEMMQMIDKGQRKPDDKGTLRTMATSENLLHNMLDWAERL